MVVEIQGQIDKWLLQSLVILLLFKVTKSQTVFSTWFPFYKKTARQVSKAC